MQPIQTVAIDREQRVDEVITAYLRAVESGQKQDRQQWLTAHPDIAADLREFFADEDQMQRLVMPPRHWANRYHASTRFVPIGEPFRARHDLAGSAIMNCSKKLPEAAWAWFTGPGR